MPTLEWIGKDKVVNHHMDVPFRVLEKKYVFGDGGENMIIHGDNLAALKSLLPRFEGRVKCVYIDPPYNTGNEGWCYNDNVSDPKMKKWLGEVVGKEGEDLSRHDKWLCMMYPRLVLLRKLLADDGCLVISISYHELHNLVEMCREIFSPKQVVTVTVQTSGGKPSSGFNYVHEYLVFVVPNDFSPHALDFCGGNTRTPFEGLSLSTFDKTQRPNQTYPIFVNKETGMLVGVGKSLQEQIDDETYIGDKEDFQYDYNVAPSGAVAIWPVTTNGKECVWRQISERLLKDWEKGYIKISRNKNSASPNLFSIQYLPSGVIKKIKNGELQVLGHEDGVPTLRFGENRTVGGQIPTIWSEKSFFTVNGTHTLAAIFPENPKAFNYPKPVELVQAIIQATTNKSDIILDSFAGSGTTAHAVLKMNAEDGGSRRFILVEMEDYAENVTAERARRVITGYGEGSSAAAGTGGGFSYYELGPALFSDGGELAVGADFAKVREYIWYMETRSPYAPSNDAASPLLGVRGDTAYYIFRGEDGAPRVLDYDLLGEIKERAGRYVIYADSCELSAEELAKFGIVFRKIPRDVPSL